VLDDVVGFRVSAMNRREGDALERVSALVVTDNFFDGLGIRTAIGQPFRAGDAAPERAPRSAVIDHSYWHARFAGDPNVVGRTMTLDGEPFTIAGVLPADYRAITGFIGPSLYVPVSALTLPTIDDRGSPTLGVVARLRAGETPARAQAAVTAIGANLERRFPEVNAGLSQPAAVFPAEALQFRGTPVGFRILPVVLLVLFGLVWLIGSVNVAGLLLSRTVSRRHELAIRTAIGASRWRVAQALLAESFLLSLAGGAVGLGLLAILERSDVLGAMPPIASAAAPGWGLLGPGLALVAVTTLVCGLAPALSWRGLDALVTLRTGTAAAVGRLPARSAFVVGQVALSLMLLVVASLCLRSQARIAGIDLGFDIDRGVVARYNVEPVQGPIEARLAYLDRVTARIGRLPGVESVAVTALVPLGGDALVAAFHPAGRSDIPGTRPSTLSVGPGYFRTLAIPLVQGREFDADHRPGAPAVAVVNQTFVRTYFPDGAAVGQRIEIGGEAEAEIVGVVRDSKIDTIGEAPRSVVYYPFAQRPRRPTVIARTAVDPATLLPAVRAALDGLDAAASVRITTLRDAASTELTMRRAGTEMVGAVGLVGLLLAAIGLYGVVSYLVVSRTTELGIRMTLGATPRRLHREVLGHAARLVGAGMAVGAVLSLLVAPALSTFLAGLSPADPLAFLTAAVVLALVAGVASAVPARRVARVDPLVALRR
jgi:putative ABC transport system permease protein